MSYPLIYARFWHPCLLKAYSFPAYLLSSLSTGSTFLSPQGSNLTFGLFQYTFPAFCNKPILFPTRPCRSFPACQPSYLHLWHKPFFEVILNVPSILQAPNMD